MRSMLLPLLLSIASFASSTPANSAQSSTAAGSTPVAASTHSRIPMDFEWNAGQFASPAVFVARGNNLRAYFTASGPVLVFEKLSAALAASTAALPVPAARAALPVWEGVAEVSVAAALAEVAPVVVAAVAEGGNKL